jgi:hypothetical protein
MSVIEHVPLTSLTFSSGATSIEANTSKEMTLMLGIHALAIVGYALGS